METLIGNTLSHYRILEKIGEGGMGAVYRAEDLRLERLVAIKLLSSDFREDQLALSRLLREARAVSALNHPNIVTIYAVEETDETAFLAMELVDGETLRERVQRAPLDLDALLRLGIEVAEALEVAHGAGIIHRDIKPSNILITSRGGAKVLDFGVAKRARPDGAPGKQAPFGGQDRTVTGSDVAGTAAYMSPEQARGENLDSRSDLFALGCVLFEAATGTSAFQGPDVLRVLRAIQNDQPPPLRTLRPEFPGTLEAVIARALSKHRDDRQASASEIAASLREIRSKSDVARGNLPGSVTSFVGRERQIAGIVERLRGGGCVTLVGAGGCGKSRLALEVASVVRTSLPHGAWLVELAALTDPGLVAQAVASAMGVRETPGRDLLDAIEDHLRERELLLVLDNCEHLLEACSSFVAGILPRCPAVSILATSREPIGLDNEEVWRVPSLTFPEADDGHAAGDLLQFEAVRLFVDRARALGAGFELTEANAVTVGLICRRLDGIPLAIELAAARARVLPVAQILSRLEDCFRILSAGTQVGLPRQQTLRATVDWSYAVLAEQERVLFDRLSVFAGGLSLESAEAVCALEPVPAEEILDLLTHLVDKSLVVPEEGPGGEARYRMLEPLRQYGRERLAARGESALLVNRHAEHFASRAEQAEAELEGPAQATWLERLQVDHDNYRLAIRSALDLGDAEMGLRITGSIWRFWWVRGYMSEGRANLQTILAMPGAARGDERRARVLVGAGRMSYELGQPVAAQLYHEEALRIRRAQGDRAGEAMSLVNLGIAAHGLFDYSKARRYYAESMTIHQELGNQRGEAICLNNLARLAYELGDLEEGANLFSRSLEIRQTLGDKRGMAISLNGLGTVALHRGDLLASREYHGRSLAIQRELGDRPGAVESLLSIGAAAATAGDADEARRFIREGLTLLREVGNQLSNVSAIDACLVLAASESNPERVLHLAGLGRAHRASSAFKRTPVDERRIGAVVAEAERVLGSARAAAALVAGASLSLLEVLEDAVKTCGVVDGHRAQ